MESEDRSYKGRNPKKKTRRKLVIDARKLKPGATRGVYRGRL